MTPELEAALKEWAAAIRAETNSYKAKCFARPSAKVEAWRIWRLASVTAEAAAATVRKLALAVYPEVMTDDRA